MRIFEIVTTRKFYRIEACEKWWTNSKTPQKLKGGSTKEKPEENCKDLLKQNIRGALSSTH